KELADRREAVVKIEERVLAKEEEIERKLVELGRKDQGLADREVHLRQLQDELKQAKSAQQQTLEQIAGMSQQEAKSHLLERGEELVRLHAAARGGMREEGARAERNPGAGTLGAAPLKRVAGSHAAETTV